MDTGATYLLSLRLLVFILPFVLVSYPFFINQRFPVRGPFRFFYYPLVSLMGCFIALFFLFALEFMKVRAQISFALPTDGALPFSKLPWGRLVLELRLPDAGGHAPEVVFSWFGRFSDACTAYWARRSASGSSIKVVLVLFTMLWTPAVTWLKRHLPQSVPYQVVASFSLASASVSAAYLGLSYFLR